jgi:dolichol-phosphate mannosyltransferase
MEKPNSEKVIILIPSLEPDEKLISYVDDLKKCGLTDIVIVDDGSSEDYQFVFHKLTSSDCIVLHHSKNLGKGSALKTGFHYIQKNYDKFACVVTVDSDGQHAVEDVVRISQLSKTNPNALTLGIRDFTKPGIPAKSLLGNRFSSAVFSAFYGEHIPDTQTGLRAFGLPLLDFMLAVNGERFEYEIRMLIACAKAGISMQMIPIQVIYENDNKGTHFKPIRDSIKIMSILFANFIRFLASSCVSAVVDLSIAWFLFDFLRPFIQTEYLRILVASAIARVISIGVNYMLNRTLVFQEKRSSGQSLIRYLMLCVLIILVSTTGVYGLNRSFGLSEKTGKIICDIVLFVLSYQVQQRWVFAKGDTKDDKQ